MVGKKTKAKPRTELIQAELERIGVRMTVDDFFLLVANELRTLPGVTEEPTTESANVSTETTSDR